MRTLPRALERFDVFVVCRYPATLIFYRHDSADKSRVRGRRNVFFSTQAHALDSFATFKAFALLLQLLQHVALRR